MLSVENTAANAPTVISPAIVAVNSIYEATAIPANDVVFSASCNSAVLRSACHVLRVRSAKVSVNSLWKNLYAPNMRVSLKYSLSFNAF